jgi:DNA-binding response OmpR family regulator
MSILLVEDDQDLATGLLEALRKEGLAINHVATGKEALHVIDAETPEIIILDLGLPDMDGLDVLKKLRKQHGDLPVLLLTARDTLGDKIAGLDSGADDYLPKPFEMAELLARLRALGRRTSTARSNVISIGSVSMDTTSQAVTVNGEPAELPRREYMLLKVLMENAGRVQTRDSLENRLYSWGEEVASNALEVHIHHLRKKLGADFVTTVRGVGYTVKAK